jgi:hypothetical protein
MIGDSTNVLIAIRDDMNAFLLRNRLRKYSSPFEYLSDRHPFRYRHDGLPDRRMFVTE